MVSSRAWRSLTARLDECEEDFAEEEASESRDGGGGDGENCGALPPPPPPSASASFSFRNVSKLTVLGLGSLEGSRTARLQAALALLLARERFPKIVSPSRWGDAKGSEEKEKESEDNRLFAADPIFTAADRDALEELGFSVVAPEEAVEAGRAGTRRRKEKEEGGEGERGGGEDEEEANKELSFFYLPHCYPPVAEEVLKAHWSSSDLEKVAILGNSLSSVAERAEERLGRKKEGDSLATATKTKTTPRCLAIGSKPSSSSPSSLSIIEASVVGPDLDAASARSGLGAAFNDTALHLFPRWTQEFAEI